MTQDYYKLKKAFISIMGNQVLFPPVDTVDLSEVKYYNSIMFISLALAVASAIIWLYYSDMLLIQGTKNQLYFY